MPLYDPDRVAAAMEDAGLDVLVATSAPHVQYLTGYRKPGKALGVVARSEPTRPALVVPTSEVDFWVEEPDDAVEVLVHGEFYREIARGASLTAAEAVVAQLHRQRRTDAGPWQLVAEAATARSAGSLTVGTDGGTEAEAAIRDVLPGTTVEHTAPLFKRLRAVKTDAEVRRLREVARLTEAAIDQSVRQVTLGVSQLQLARAFRRCAAELDAWLRSDSISIDGGAALGNVNVPGDLVERGSIIRYDVGLFFDGYASDISRCYAFLHASDKVATYHHALVEGQARALAVLRPGVRACDVFKVAVDGVRESGLGHYERTHVGHGIGIAGAGYDLPLLAPQDETPLEAGMVLCVETPYYELGFGGLQVEDMVVVTDDGYESLTHAPRELRVLP